MLNQSINICILLLIFSQGIVYKREIFINYHIILIIYKSNKFTYWNSDGTQSEGGSSETVRQAVLTATELA